jgi:hypothetical protein
MAFYHLVLNVACPLSSSEKKPLVAIPKVYYFSDFILENPVYQSG